MAGTDPPEHLAAPHRVAPFMAAGRRVLVDGHPICAECGTGAVPLAPGQWGHAPPGRPYPYRSRYLAPLDWARRDWAALREVTGYRDFADRYPWAVDPGYGPVTTPEHWEQGRYRLERYRERLARYERGGERCRDLSRDGNPYASLLAELAGGRVPVGDWRLAPGLAQLLDLPARRRELVRLFAWAVPSPAACAAIAEHGPVLECGAGTGYWAALLRRRGVDVLACDARPIAAGHDKGGHGKAGHGDAGHVDAGHGNAYHAGNSEPWSAVDSATSVAAVRAHPSRTLLLCWPPPDDDAASYAVLRAYRGDVLLYVGGGPDGPTGTVRFHRELEANWTLAEEVAIPTWPGLRDRLAVLRRNPVPSVPVPASPQAARGRAGWRRDRCPECGRFVPTGWPGRCDGCFRARPPALALRCGRYRIEYSRRDLAGMPAALRTALLASPNRIEPGPPPVEHRAGKWS